MVLIAAYAVRVGKTKYAYDQDHHVTVHALMTMIKDVPCLYTFFRTWQNYVRGRLSHRYMS